MASDIKSHPSTVHMEPSPVGKLYVNRKDRAYKEINGAVNKA